MKKITLYIFAFFATTISFGQNLITNGNVENTNMLTDSFVEDGWFLKTTGSAALYTEGIYAYGNNSILHQLSVGTFSRFGLTDFIGDNLIVTGVTYQISVKGITNEGSAGKALQLAYRQGTNNAIVGNLVETPSNPKL